MKESVSSLRITVGRNDEDYTSIQEALNAVPYGIKAEIVISSGYYNEKLFSDKDDLTLRGVGKVVVANSDAAYEILDRNTKRGTFRSYTAFFSGRKLLIENMTIMNGAGEGSDAGQAIALYLDAEDAELRNVRLLGHQDTLFLSPLPDEERERNGFYGPRHLLPRERRRSIFRNCYIEGTVDFIFGGGDALFENSEIRSIGKGYVTAPSGKKNWTGLVFARCSFTSSCAEEGSVYLMRPWRKEGKSTFISCSFGSHIKGSGFTPWPGREDEMDECTFLLNNCSFSAEVAVDGKHRLENEDAASILSLFS